MHVILFIAAVVGVVWLISVTPEWVREIMALVLLVPFFYCVGRMFDIHVNVANVSTLVGICVTGCMVAWVIHLIRSPKSEPVRVSLPSNVYRLK